MKKKLIIFTILLTIVCKNSLFTINTSLGYTNHVHSYTYRNTLIDPDPIKTTQNIRNRIIL